MGLVGLVGLAGLVGLVGLAGLIDPLGKEERRNWRNGGTGIGIRIGLGLGLGLDRFFLKNMSLGSFFLICWGLLVICL